MRITMLLAVALTVWAVSWSLPRADGQVSFLKNELIELALDQLRSPGSFDVSVGSAEDGADGLTNLLDVRISDGSGVWATVERVAFAWQPRRLLAGELAISHLEIAGAAVLRSPAAEAEWPELDTQPPWQQHLLDWPRAPIALALDRILLKRFEVREGVLPQPIRFDAEGRMHDREGVQEIALSLRRTDAVAGEIVLETRRAFSEGTLRLLLEADEAAGGMVAAATGLPADVPSRLRLSGDGPPDDWRLAFEASVEDVLTAEGRATVDYAGTLMVDSEFSVRPGPAMDPDARALLGDRARLVAKLAERERGQFDVIGAKLTVAAATLQMSGTFSTGTGANDLAVSLEAGPAAAALLGAVAFERLTFSGAVTGPIGALEASGALAIETVQGNWASAAGITARADVTQLSEGAAFVFHGDIEGLRSGRLGPDTIGDATVFAEGTVHDRRLMIRQAALTSGLLSGRARGHYDAGTGAGELAAALDIDELAPFTGIAGTALRGALTASAEVQLADGMAEADVTVAARDLAAGGLSMTRATLSGRISRTGERWGFHVGGDGAGVVVEGVPGELATDASMALEGSLQNDTLRLASLAFMSPLMEADVRGEVATAAGRLDLAYRVQIPDLSRVAAAYGQRAGGVAEAAGRATGTLDQVHVAGEASVRNGAFGGRSYGRVGLIHELRIDDAIAGPVDVNVDDGWLGGSHARFHVRLDRDIWRVGDVRAELPGITLASDAVTVMPDSMLVDGAGTVVSADLGPLAALGGVSATGTAGGTFAFRARGDHQTFASKLQLEHVDVAGIRAEHLTLDVAVQDLAAGEGLEAAVYGAAGSVGALAVDDLRITVSGALSDMTFSAGADGSLEPHRLELALAGQAAVAEDQFRITLASGTGSIGPERVDLVRPLEARIGRDAGRVELRELALRLAGGGRVEGSLSWRSGGIVGGLDGVRIPLALLGHLTRVPAVSGFLDVAITFDTRRTTASAVLDAAVSDLVLTGVAADHALSADLSGRWDGARLDMQAMVRGGIGEPVDARLTLPVRPSAEGIPRLSRRDPIDGTLSWRGNVAELWAVLPPSSHVVEGDVDLQLRFAGTVDAPRVSGHAEVAGGRWDQVDAGLALTDIAVRAALTDSAVITLRGSASDGGQGRIEGDATVHLDPGPAIEAVVRVDRAALLQRDDVAAWISGTGDLHGPWNDLSFRGAFTIDEAEVRLVDVMPPDAVELNGVRLAHAAEEPEAEEAQLVTLDVTVRAERSVFVRGRGLESEWGLDLRATGDVTDPVLYGAVRKLRGDLELLGKPFELTRGEIVFDGTDGFDPVLDVSLERQAMDAAGGIYVDGRLSRPRVRFGSTSGLPADEVLPRLVFGVSQQSLSGPQALQLSLGVARLLGHGGGLQDWLREAAGVDVLRVSGTTAEDAAVAVGQNLSDQVYVGAEQQIGSGQSSIVVEVEVMENVIVDSRLEAGRSANVGVSWRRDY